MLNRLRNLSNGHFFDLLAPPPWFVDNRDSPNKNTDFFPDCCLLSATNGSISTPYLARYSEIFKKPNFQAVKWESTFIWKMLYQAELETEGSRLAIIFGSPPTPPGTTGRPEIDSRHFLTSFNLFECRPPQVQILEKTWINAKSPRFLSWPCGARGSSGLKPFAAARPY